MRIGNLNVTWGTTPTPVKDEPAPQPVLPSYRWKDDNGNVVYGDTLPAFVQVLDPRYVLAAACKDHHVYEIPTSVKFEPGPLSICRNCGKRVYWCVAEERSEWRPGFWPTGTVDHSGNWYKHLGTDEVIRVKDRKFYRWVK